MDSIQWLRKVEDGPWGPLADALRRGLNVPDGFVVGPRSIEQEIRDAYDELKQREKTHFVAVRHPTHALLDVLGTDILIHKLRRLWIETPEALMLIQRMVNSEWCGNVSSDEKPHRVFRILANEGMSLLDPDVYLFNRVSGKCTRRTLQKRQRKMFRWVDGSSRTIDLDGRRTSLTADQLQAIAALAESARGEITWSMNDNRLWLIGIRRSSLPS